MLSMKKSINQYFQFLLLLEFVFQSQLAWSQYLPLPSGQFSIGHVRFEWTDFSRKEILTENMMRSIVADVWYPAENSCQAEVTPYIDTLAIHAAFGNNGLQSLLGKTGSHLIRSGKVQTHAHDNAKFFQSLGSVPMIFFSHGMGMITQLYTTQIEDLASHGYVVVAITHPYDAWLVSFKNGNHIPFETKLRNAAGNSEEQHITYENERIVWWADDIKFALDQMTSFNTMDSQQVPFAGHLDLNHVGVMGHSAGGRAAARACQIDQRMISCADQDGVAMMQPFYPGPDGLGMTQTFLLFERVNRVKLSESDATSMGMTLSELTALVARLRQDKETALAATGGSYHVLLNFNNSSHMSFSDLPLLQANNDIEVSKARKLLEVTCRYTREFFDKTIRNQASPLYEGRKKLMYIDLVEKYSKSSKRK
jgi:hypothetical protein